MADFQYSKWDGSQEFTPQSTDRLFDELSKYMLNHGEMILDNALDEDQQEGHPGQRQSRRRGAQEEPQADHRRAGPSRAYARIQD